MRADRVLRPAALLVLTLTLGACSRGTPTGTGNETYSPVPATNAATASSLPTDAEALPEITPESYRRLLGELKGTPVVVNVWGSWCAPCREEAPLLAKASKTFGKQIQFVGLDVLDTRPSARTFMDQFHLTYPSLYDPSASGDTAVALGLIGQPATIFYDASGKKVSDWGGQITQEELSKGIASILPAATSGTPSPKMPS